MMLDKSYYLLFLIIPPLVIFLMRRDKTRRDSKKDKASLVLRLCAVSLLSLALAGLAIPGKMRPVNVIYSVDVSRSVGEGAPGKFLRTVMDAARNREGIHNAGVILFGNGSRFLPPSTMQQVNATTFAQSQLYSDGLMSSGTDIALALKRAVGYFKDGAVNRVALFTDGRQTTGDAIAAAAALRAVGGELLIAPVDRPEGGVEVSVQDIIGPRVVRAMEPFKLRVLINSDGEVDARLNLFEDGLLVESREALLSPGINDLPFKSVVEKEGLRHYRAVVYPASDFMTENNVREAFVRVSPKPRILLVHGEGEDSTFLFRALAAQGFDVVGGGVEKLPSSLRSYIGYSAVILQNVYGLGISMEKLELLERYVRDAAGGLVVIGGDKSFDRGYLDTALGRMMPVSVGSPSSLSVPGVALVLVIDKSSSMNIGGGKVNKLELAKTASFSALEMMQPFDRVGLLAFDTHHFWAVPMVRAAERERFAAGLRTIAAGGGTDLYPALEEAYRKLRTEDSAIKHVFVLSDGLTDDKGFQRLVGAMASDKITVSTVAMGDDANLKLMKEISRRGGGRFYFVTNPGEMTRIFLNEAMLVSRKTVVEGDVIPVPTGPHPVLQNIDADSLPRLGGYVRTYPRKAAGVVIAARRGDPLLTGWQYGLGRVMVFTSDLSNRWGVEWVKWGEFGKLAAHIVRHVSSSTSTNRVEVDYRVDGGKSELIVDLYDRDDDFVNLADLSGRLVGPGGKARELAFVQTAPGRYKARLDEARPGSYMIKLRSSLEGYDRPMGTTGFSIPYQREYASWGVDRKFLSKLALAGGGIVLEKDDLEKEIYRPSSKVAGGRDLWPILALAALVCYFLSIAVARWPRTR